MNKSESIKELAQALSKAQGQMESAVKDSTNPYFKSSYADLASVIQAIKKPFSDNGLSFVQVSHDREGFFSVETILLHSSGEFFSTGIVTVPVVKNDPQAYGSASTYCRRYSLQMAAGVPAEDDDGNAASNTEKKILKPTSNPKPEQKRVELRELTDEEFDKRSSNYKQLVIEGKKTAEETINFLNTKCILTDRQISIIQGWGFLKP